MQAPTWGFRALAQALPDGLPTGALTVISLPNQGVRRGPWSTIVGQLLLDVLDRCMPAAYTYADDPHQDWPTAGANPLGEHYLTAPDTCGCCPVHPGHFATAGAGVAPIGPSRSTVDTVRMHLADHEFWYGPTLAIIDNVDHVRPYAYLPGGIFDSAGDVAAARENALQCAADLVAFATSRPTAPTVVTWHHQARYTGTIEALADVARVIITASKGERRRPVRLQIQSRRRPSDPWSPATIVLPWFDWGFDDRDLDEEDIQASMQADGDATLDPADPMTDPWAVDQP